MMADMPATFFAVTCRCISTSSFAMTSAFNPAFVSSGPCGRGLKFSAGGKGAPVDTPMPFHFEACAWT
jgi:hypothetical protein